MNNKVLETIFRKMCEIGGRNYDDFKWFNDEKHINTMWKYPDAEDEFIDWLTEYMRNLKISELRQIVEYPYTCYRRKKMCNKFANHFVFMYGFKTYKESIIDVRKKKIKNIMNNENNA